MQSVFESQLLNQPSDAIINKAEDVCIDVTESSSLVPIQAEVDNASEQNLGSTSLIVKQFVKRFLEQSQNTALGGAVFVNHAILAFTLLGHNKLSAADHQHLEMALLGYWGLRGGVAATLELTGLKNKAPDALTFYSLTEKNIIKILAITSFLRKMPIPFGVNATLQIAYSMMVILEQSLSAKSIIEKQPDPSGASYPEIKKRHPDNVLLSTGMTVKEMAFRGIQMGAATYVSANTLADIFVDAVSPIDPPNQEQIIQMIALIAVLFGAASVVNLAATKAVNFVRTAQINTGLILLPLVSLMYDFLPDWFANNSLETGLIALSLVVIIPAFLELLVALLDISVTSENHVAEVPVNSSYGFTFFDENTNKSIGNVLDKVSEENQNTSYDIQG